MDADKQKIEIAKSITKLWTPLNDEQQQEFAREMLIVYPHQGEAFFRDGEEPLYIYYLIQGSVSIYQTIDKERRLLVRMVEPKGIFGTQAAFASEYYQYSAFAGENTIAALFPISLIFHYIWEVPGFALAFIQDLSVLLGTSVNHTIHLTQKHIRGRLAETILRIKTKYGTEADGKTLPLYLSRNDMAMMSNMTTSNAIRTLSAFVSEGVVNVIDRKIVILNETELRRISDIG